MGRYSTVLRKLSRPPTFLKLIRRFLEDHPGGAKAILLYAGREATEEFEMVHPANTLEKHAKHIGTFLPALPRVREMY
jgi:hypothetical protein